MKAYEGAGGILLAGIFVVSIALLCGCVSEEKNSINAANAVTVSRETTISSTTAMDKMATTKPETEHPMTSSTTTTSAPATTLALKSLPLGGVCTGDDQCMSGCCALSKSRKKCRESSFCEMRELGEEDCYKKGLYWCIDKCQSNECGNCSSHMRCVTVSDGGSDVAKVEVAQPVGGKAGSCRYSGTYVNAGGEASYCDKHEGKLTYAKCGSPPQMEDCLRIYKDNVMYWIAQRRSFHSPEGEASDLWCYRCTQAV